MTTTGTSLAPNAEPESVPPAVETTKREPSVLDALRSRIKPPEGSGSRLLKTVVLLSGAGLAALSLWLQKKGGSALKPWQLWSLLAVGLGVFAAASQMADESHLPGWAERWLMRVGAWMRLTSRQAAALLAGPLLAVLAFAAAGVGPRMEHPALAVLAWMAAIGLVMAAGWQSFAQRPSFPRRAAMIALLLGVAAFAIRVYDTTHIPIVLSGDEASAGLSAVEFVKGNTNNLFTIGWYSFPSLYYAVASIPIALLGQTTEALRVPAALVGALTVVAVYFAARSMFGERTALFAAVFLLALHFHNHFSRIGLNNVWDGLWFVLVVWLAWLGWQTGERPYFLWAGLALGLSQYFYVTGRMLFVLVPVWIVISGLFDRPRLKRSLPGLVLMLLVAVVVFLPLGLFYSRFPAEFSAPMNRVSIFGTWLTNAVQITGLPAWKVLLNQIVLGLQAYTHAPLRTWYTPNTPMLRFYPSILFYLGAALLLVKWRDSRTILLAMWLVAFGLTGGLSESTPAAQRYVAAAPAAAILVGFGLAESASLLQRLWPRPAWLAWALAAAALLWMSYDDLNFYYRVYTPSSDFGGDNTLVAQRLANYLQGKDSSWKVYFFGEGRMGYRSISSLPYLAPHITGIDVPFPANGTESLVINGDKLIFVVLPPDSENSLRSVESLYPGGTLRTENVRQGEVLYWLYEVAPTGAGPLPAQPLQITYPPPGDPSQGGAYP